MVYNIYFLYTKKKKLYKEKESLKIFEVGNFGYIFSQRYHNKASISPTNNDRLNHLEAGKEKSQ